MIKIELTSPVSAIPFISDAYSKKFENLDIFTVKDLLTYFPYRYTENTNLKTISEILLDPDEEDRYLLRVQIRGMKNIFVRGRRMTLQEGIGYDDSGEIKLSWFNQKFLPETLKPNTQYLLSGRVKVKGKHTIFFPDNYEQLKEGKDIVHLRDFAPEYSLTSGISKKWLRNRIQYLVKNIDNIDIPNELEEYGYNLKDSLAKLHFPDDISQVEKAVKELSLYEFTNIQLHLLEKRNSRKLPPAPSIDKEIALDYLNKAVKNLPFELTVDQQAVLDSLVNKMIGNELIDSMIQGDVGSGKTIIAVLLALIVAKSGYQVIVLAPTTILAEQHFKNFSNYLGNDLNIGLITSKTTNSNPDILIGTTAILSRKADLIKKPGLVIVDEQHKFGVNQREELLKEYDSLYSNTFFPHFLNMSATPIPRTVIEFIFGDVAVEYIKTKPSGRAEIKTRLFEESKREDLIHWVKEKMSEGDRVYWVVPAIESEEANLKNIPIIKAKLMEHFKEEEIGVLHGKMKENQKQEAMAKFASGATKLLLSTSVIEVGIDVPEATVMVIENPERFGLAQLHQIRGRVGRSHRESWCFLSLSANMTEAYEEKLKFFCETSDGMAISQFDLTNRGPGEIYGTKQSGIPNLKIADFSDFESMMSTKDIAKKLYDSGIRNITIFSNSNQV